MRSGQTQNPTDQTTNFFWMLILIVIVVLAVWFFKREFIVAPIFWVRLQELYLVDFASRMLQHVQHWLPFHIPTIENFAGLEHFLSSSDPKKVSWIDFSWANATLGNLVRFPIAIILVVLAVYVYFRHGQLRFSQVHNMKTILKLEQQNWPQITPVLNLDLVSEDLTKGPWAMSENPIEFCRKHDIVEVKLDKTGAKVHTIKQGPARRLLTMQLGPLWQGADKLPIHIKALLVVFVARAERDRDVAHKLLAQIARSAATGKLDFTGVEAALQKYKRSKVVRWLEKRHAYLYTLMSSMLEIARTDGVLATAEFLWLKPVDRRLWYVLNTVGRQTSFVEVAGPYAHWRAEKKVGHAVKTPMVKEAVSALQSALEDTLYVDQGDKWHTLSED